MADLEVLLEVQAHDTASDQLQHRKANLAERAELEQLLRDQATARRELERSQKDLDAAVSHRNELEKEVTDADSRISSIEARMFGGTVSAGRELESMSAEVDSLKARRSTLEDQALEAMEGEETARTERERMGERMDALSAAVASAEQRLTLAESELDELIEAEAQARHGLISELAPELVASYERIRAKLGGIGAARLEGDRCQGCHLSLPSGEVERLRHEPPDAVLYCDNCTRILVR